MRTRSGFTLVELMVSMALTMFVMVILTQAFVLSLETFTGLKGIGDMQQNLRTAEMALRDDLSQDHFEGKRRLSDLDLSDVTSAHHIVSQPPQAGFFVVARNSAVGSAQYVHEGNDANIVPSYRATDHVLYMTVKRKGNRPENYFTAALQGNAVDLGAFFGRNTAYNVPTENLSHMTMSLPYTAGATVGYYRSQWAEVAYYLVRTGSTEQPNNPASTLGTPTYALYRAQFVMVPDGTNVNLQLAVASGYQAADLDVLSQTTFAGMSCNLEASTSALTFYSPADAALGKRVIPDISAFLSSPSSRIQSTGALILPNVLSFQVQSMQIGSSTFDDAVAPTTPYYYDTAHFGTAGYANGGLKGVQITLRVWDPNTRQTRQTTIVQDL